MSKKRPVLITTAHRGVFFGYADDTTGSTVQLDNARCAIIWGTKGGFLELASDGPNKVSKIGSRALSILLRDVTSVSEVSQKAVRAWEEA